MISCDDVNIIDDVKVTQIILSLEARKKIDIILRITGLAVFL